MAVERAQKRVSGAVVRPISPQGHTGRHGPEANGHAVCFLLRPGAPREELLGPTLFEGSTRWGNLASVGEICSQQAVRLQLGLPYGGCSSISVRTTQQRCSRPLLRPLPAAATKIKTAAAKMETSAPSSSGAPQTRWPGARQNRVRAERHLGAWKEVRASR